MTHRSRNSSVAEKEQRCFNKGGKAQHSKAEGTDYVSDDLDAIGHAYDWWRKCKNREDWIAVIQVLLDVPSPKD